jgi:hypothetical protein
MTAVSNMFIRASAAVLALIVGVAPPALAQDPPDDLGQWGLHCFCLTARHTPQRVIRMDDNGRLLRHAVGGATLGELRARGLAVTDSQVLLLRTYGLLDQTGERLTTTFPVIGPEEMDPLRARLRRLAEATAPSLADDTRTIAERLKATGYPDHAYAVVFGYALDGLVWDELRLRGALPDITLDLDHPIWRGAFWALYPERSGVPGTNEATFGDQAIVSVWTDSTVGPLDALLRPRGGSAGTADRPWLARVPTLHAIAGDRIHDVAKQLAARTASALMDTPDGKALLAAVPHASRQHAVLILAHEFIWYLMEDLVRVGAVRAPAVLGVTNPTSDQLTPLLFIRAPARG